VLPGILRVLVRLLARAGCAENIYPPLGGFTAAALSFDSTTRIESHRANLTGVLHPGHPAASADMSVPNTRRPSLRAQLSGSLAAAAGGSGGAGGNSALDPQLRAALDRQPQQGSAPGRVSFAARAALDSGNPEASLALFKRLRSGGGERQAPLPQALPAAAPPVADSARFSEADAGRPASQASLADELLDAGWFGGAKGRASSDSGGSGSGDGRSAFAAAAAAQLLPSPQPSEALPPLPRCAAAVSCWCR
jgi:hypothetical protein